MTIFEGMILAHILGDWLLQTEWQAKNKASDWRAMFVHIALYHLVLLATLWLGFSLHGWYTVIIVGGLAVSHAILDQRAFVRWVIRAFRLSVNREPESWFCIVIDQSLHFLLLGVAAALLSFWRP